VGSSEVTTAVIASTATNLVVFLPIAAMSSMAGQFFKEFALTVSFATVFSLLMAFTLTPMLASLILPKEEKLNWFGRIMENVFQFFEKKYEKMLNVVLASRARPVFFTILMVIALFATFIFVAPKLGFEFMPEFDQGDIIIKVELPEGSTLEQTGEKLKEIEEIVLRHEEVKHVIMNVGDDNNTHIGSAEIKLVDPEFRELITSEMNQVFISEVATVTGAKIFCKGNRDEGGQSPIQYFLLSTDKELLDSYVPALNAKMKQVDGLINYDITLRTGKPQLTILPKRKVISDAGITAYDLAMTVRAATEGLTTSVYRENGEEYDIRVTFEDASITTPEEIGALTVSTPYGPYTISQLADVTNTQTTTQITHRDKLASLVITGEPATGYPLASVTNKMQQVFDEMDFSSEIEVKVGGQAEDMGETNKDMGQAFGLAIILTYMLLASLLESFTQPFLILTTLPMATIGVFLLMFATGTTMNLFSMMAIIMLIGLVVNDAILILDYTKTLMDKEKLSAKEALLIACPTKMKPVLMTTLAIILGMLPMAMGIGSAGKEVRIPMAMVQIGGMATSTILTLLLIPSLFYLTHSKKEKKRK
jgi:HAE1 family hydrophobic/amphiphilic exporter-1